MLVYSESRFDFNSSKPLPQAPNGGIVDSGQCLALVDDGTGLRSVKASAGTAGEIFAGMSITDVGVPARLPGALAIVGTGAAFTVTLPSTYIASSAVIINNTTKAAEPGNSTKITISGSTLSITAAATATDSYTVLFSYVPTVDQIQNVLGDFPRQTATDAGALIGVAQRGFFVTTNFDTTVAWNIGDVPKMGANGIFTKGGSGSDCAGFVVCRVPSPSRPFLGIEAAI